MSASSQQIVTIARILSNRTLPADAERESPEVTEALGGALVQALRSHSVDAVVLWSDPHTAVLGHVVARELRANLIYAYADQGILSLSTTPEPNSQLAVVDFEWEPNPGLTPLLTMLRRSASVVAVASVLRPPTSLNDDDIAEAAVISLESNAPSEGTAS